jgi:hypothetical protein
VSARASHSCRTRVAAPIPVLFLKRGRRSEPGALLAGTSGGQSLRQWATGGAKSCGYRAVCDIGDGDRRRRAELWGRSFTKLIVGKNKRAVPQKSRSNLFHPPHPGEAARRGVRGEEGGGSFPKLFVGKK